MPESSRRTAYPKRAEIAAICRTLLRERALAIEPPAGRRRRSFRVRLESRSVIVTRRADRARARLEAMVLGALGAEGAPVPRIIAFRDDWLIQEDLGALRLSAALAESGPEDASAWLDRALLALASCHDAAARARLAARVPALGVKRAWIEALVAMPEGIGGRMGLPPPALDRGALLAALEPRPRAFVKWDARPGNAIARADGTVSWFDWEHCGARDALDDLAWLLADEYVALSPEAERRLLDRHLDAFARRSEHRDPEAYLRTFGAFHICVRLALVLHHRGEGTWWDRARCIADDKVGVTRDGAVALALRGARWADASPAARALGPWFADLAPRLAAL